MFMLLVHMYGIDEERGNNNKYTQSRKQTNQAKQKHKTDPYLIVYVTHIRNDLMSNEVMRITIRP